MSAHPSCGEPRKSCISRIGEVAEWLKVAVSKTVELERVPRVRIPPSPPVRGALFSRRRAPRTRSDSGPSGASAGGPFACHGCPLSRTPRLPQTPRARPNSPHRLPLPPQLVSIFRELNSVILRSAPAALPVAGALSSVRLTQSTEVHLTHQSRRALQCAPGAACHGSSRRGVRAVEGARLEIV